MKDSKNTSRAGATPQDSTLNGDIQLLSSPIRPVITEIYSDSGTTTGVVERDTATDDAMPRFSGTAEPGSLVQIYSVGIKLGEGYADENGNFSFLATTPLPVGSQRIVARTEQENGSWIFSETYNIGYNHIRHPSDPDLPANPVPVLSRPVIEGAYDNRNGEVLVENRYTEDTTPLLKGTADPHAIVYITNYLGMPVGSVQANEDGNWALEIAGRMLPPYQAVAVDPNDSSSVSYASETIDVRIGVAPPPPPLPTPDIWSVHDNEGSNSRLTSGDTTDDTTPTFSGGAYARGMTIVVRDNGKEIGQTEVNSDGEWTWTPSPALEAGSYTLTFEVVDSEGNVHASEPFMLEVVIPVVAQILYADDNVGDVTDALHSGDRTDDETPTLHGSGNPNSLVKIYYQGYYYLGSAKSNANGEWSFTPSSKLPAGTHSFFAREVNEHGTELTKSPEFTLEIVPVTEYTAPTISNVYDNVLTQKYLSNGSITDDTTPRFSGRGTPNSTIEVRDNDKVIAEVPVDRYGNWSWTATQPLEAGDYRFSFVTVGEDGREYASADFNLEIISQVTGRITSADDNVGAVTDALSSGGRTDDTTPTLNGVGTPDGIVTIWDNWNPIGSAKINANGEWSFTPSSALAAGAHNFYAKVTGPDGTVLANSPNFALTIAPPVSYTAPTISNVYDNVLTQKYLSNGSITDDTTPRFSGRGTPNSTIEVRDNDKVIAEVPVDRYGNWSWTATQPLEAGDYRFSFVTVGEDGREYASADFNLEIISQVTGRIDSAEDNVGAVTDALSSGGRTDDTTPTLNGVGTPDGIVRIYDNNRLIGSAKINESGEWSFTPSSALAAGAHNFYARVTGPDGTVLANSPNFALTIAPPVSYTAPTISNVYDNVLTQKYLSNGSITDDTTPRFSGRGTPNSTIEVRDNDKVIAEVPVDRYGNWSWTATQPLETGDYRFSFVTVGEDGREYASADFNLEIISQVTGRITSAGDNVGAVTDPLSSGGRTDDTTPTLNGVGTPDGIVRIYDNNRLIGSAKINESGEWSFTPSSALAAGAHNFYAKVTGPDGTVLANSPNFALTIAPPVSYTAPTISNVYDNVLTQKYLSNGSITDDTTPRFSGRGTPNSTIEVRDNDKVIAEVPVDRYGNWSWTATQPLEAGDYRFSFVTVGEDGREYASADFNLEIISQVTGRITSADDNVGAVTDPLTSGARTDDTTPTLNGVGTPDGIVRIYDNNRLIGSAKINESGEWSFTPSSALAAGAHNFYAKVTGPDGTVLANSPNFALTIAPPVSYTAPTISNVYDNVLTQKYLSNGSITDDTTPRFSGRGTPNSTIEVRDNDKVIAEVPVDRYGNWSWTATQPLETGDYRFSFVTVGEDGREYASADFNLEIISHVTGRIVSADDNVGEVTDPLTSGARTDDTTPTLNGVGTPDGIVRIYDNNRLIGSAKINESGEWSFTPSSALAAGAHNFYAKVTGPDGTVLANSPNFALTIAPPVSYTAPTISNVYDNVLTQKYLSNGSITDDTTPRFSGRGTPNSTIEVRDNDKVIAEVPVDRYGNWSWTATQPLEAGDYRFSFVTVGEDGREYASADFNLEIISHVAGRIVSADDNVGEVTDALTSGSTTDDAQPTLRGVGTPGGSVEIFYDGKLMSYAEINNKGEWSYTPNSTLSNGSHEFYVVVTSPDGTTLPAGPTFSLIINAPVVYFAPVIDGAASNVHGLTMLYNGDATDDATPYFAGKGLADSTIAVYINDQYYGEAKVDPWGVWTYTPSPALEKGEHTFTFVTVDDKGDEYISEAFTLHVDPAIPLTILSADDDVGAVTDPLLSGSSTDDSQPTLRGTGKPGSIIEIFGTDGVFAKETIGPEGNWSWTPDKPLPAGDYSFIGTIRDSAGNELERTDWFELTITAPEIDRSLTVRSLLQDADVPLFDEPQTELSTTQPVEPTAFIPASAPLVQEWESTTNHY
ncbi:Ig-like domain-containing protein [Duffyella gerundensis]|uniref:Ig-like domain-containing protein n=1 Tax=Duffyella gerundensis TaxID=1619313 RepID=UPI0021F78772|nr:Ig-like domain-containing protein [Duffyella gerundensis]